MASTSKRPLDLRHLRTLIAPIRVLRLVGWRETIWQRTLARGPCPIHRSTSPRSRSLIVSAEVVYCHSCHWTGDAVALWSRLQGLTVLDAAYQLCERFAIDPPYLLSR